jgi:predicted Zn-dependent protease
MNTRNDKRTSHPDTRYEALLDEALQLKNCSDFRGAVRVLGILADEYPRRPAAFGLLGAIYLAKLKQPAKAVAYLVKATKLSPKSEMASLGLFHALWKLDRLVDALEELKRFQSISHCQDYVEILAEIKEKWLS